MKVLLFLEVKINFNILQKNLYPHKEKAKSKKSEKYVHYGALKTAEPTL